MQRCACGEDARFQAVLSKGTFQLRFEAIPRDAERGLFYCASCAEEMLAMKGLALHA